MPDNTQILVVLGTAVSAFALGFGANEALSTSIGRARLGWDEAIVFRETVDAGITKASYEALAAERDKIKIDLERALALKVNVAGVINSGRAVDLGQGWIYGKVGSSIDSARYETLTCEDQQDASKLDEAATKICGPDMIASTEEVYISRKEYKGCPAKLIAVTCRE